MATALLGSRRSALPCSRPKCATKPFTASPWRRPAVPSNGSRIAFRAAVKRVSVAVVAAATDLSSFKEASKVAVGAGADAAQVPSSAGVYAVYSSEDKLEYIGISRKMSVSIAGHLKEVPELCHSVKFSTADDDSRENLTTLWKLWVEEAVTETGDIPPGNAPGDSKWRAKPKATARPDIKLTAGKGITGITIEQLIEQVVKTNPVVAFMKGTRVEPQCGFSAKLVTILNENQVNYEVVNVLDEHYNPGLRDAIKAYSQWPTIPQLYVKGEFVGGSDIVEQMNQSGELKQLLKP